MPIYEYECTKCGHIRETWQKFSDPPITKCELCQGKMKRLISQSTFHLKGTGWYVTDYASKRDDGKSAKEPTTKEAKASTDQSSKDLSSKSEKKDKD